MKTLPIIDFENEYVITDEGNVVDLYDNEIKTTYRMNNFSANLLVVDLYKEGELVLTISIKQLVVLHFFKITKRDWVLATAFLFIGMVLPLLIKIIM
jgi:hypothetical protein